MVKRGANKDYIGYVGSAGFRPFYIIMKTIQLCTNHMNVLANNNELLKHIQFGIRLKPYSIKEGCIIDLHIINT